MATYEPGQTLLDPFLAAPGGTTAPTATGLPGGTPAGGSAGGLDEKQSKRIAEGVNEEYHDPYDDWSSRDTLLALVPVIMAFALQDAAFRVGLIIAVAGASFLLVMRTVAWDSRYKKVWPMLELISVPLFAILLGLSFVNLKQVNKWFPTITGITLAFTALVGRRADPWVTGGQTIGSVDRDGLWSCAASFGGAAKSRDQLSLMWRRPFTAHYARYPKFDRGGSLLWRHTPTWRRTSDVATLGWFTAFTVWMLLTLAPQLTGHHAGSHALNVIFNYITPAVFSLAALIYQQMLGNHYRKSTVRNLDRYFGRAHISHVPGTGTMQQQATYPSGPAEAQGATNV
ncbi:hypothetical protein PLESTM_000563200 [Pleodorina starrii]|nr:hypothetical protein PLESTM_000563200 [Pleodorina starrii]